MSDGKALTVMIIDGETWYSEDDWRALVKEKLALEDALARTEATLKRLVFSNAEATPKNTYVECSEASVPQIMAWYGAYHAGDRYTVTFDGRNIPMDHNGEAVE